VGGVSMGVERVTIFTDGACAPNPGPGGYAAIILNESKREDVVGSDRYTTNNRMELMGVIAGLEKLDSPSIVDIYADSAYIVNAFNNHWIDKWKRNGWKSSTGDVKNPELWKRLLALCQTHKVYFHKVKGHDGNTYNELCDKLAVNARKSIS